MLEALEQQLDALGITLAEFSELSIRLLDYGIISRDDSQVEQQLYDRLVRCEALLVDYFAVLRIRLMHDKQFHFVRLYPPGAEVPGLPSQEMIQGAPLRQRPSQNEVALILVLRTLYDQGLREARLDEQGIVATTVENVGITLRNLMGRSLPENITERRQLWRRLRQWRLIRMAEDAVLDPVDAVLHIRPTIVSLVSDAVLQQLEQPGPVPVSEDMPAEQEDERVVDDSAVTETMAESR